MTINFMPATTADDIAQTVRVITGTTRGSQPLDRGLGIDGRFLDMAGSRGQALLAADIIETLPAQEPRIDVRSVRTAGDPASGEYAPVIDYGVIG